MDLISDSNLYISFRGDINLIDEESRKRIDNAFKRIFNTSFKKVSDPKSLYEVEIIYEVSTPIFKDDNSNKEFYKKLNKLFFDLEDYCPHFTQFKRGDGR